MLVNTEAGTVSIIGGNVPAFVKTAKFNIYPDSGKPVECEFTMDDMAFVADIHKDAVEFEGSVTFPVCCCGFRLELHRYFDKASGWLRNLDTGEVVDTTGITKVEIDASDMANIKVKFISAP